MPEGIPDVLVIGIILLILGYVLGIGILETIGALLAGIGLLLLLFGYVGHPIGGRRWYW